MKYKFKLALLSRYFESKETLINCMMSLTVKRNTMNVSCNRAPEAVEKKDDTSYFFCSQILLPRTSILSPCFCTYPRTWILTKGKGKW